MPFACHNDHFTSLQVHLKIKHICKEILLFSLCYVILDFLYFAMAFSCRSYKGTPGRKKWLPSLSEDNTTMKSLTSIQIATVTQSCLDVLTRILERKTTNRMCTYNIASLIRFIMRNILLRLWKKICPQKTEESVYTSSLSLKAWEPREPVVQGSGLEASM